MLESTYPLVSELKMVRGTESMLTLSPISRDITLIALFKSFFSVVFCSFVLF